MDDKQGSADLLYTGYIIVSAAAMYTLSDCHFLSTDCIQAIRLQLPSFTIKFRQNIFNSVQSILAL